MVAIGNHFPLAYSVPGLDNVAVPLGGSVGPVVFRFSAVREVTGLLLMPASGLVADLAMLSLEIVDEDDDELFSDQLGDVAQGVRLPFAVPGLSLAGMAFRPFPLVRLVRPADRWWLTVRNASAAPITLAELLIFSKVVR